ncbi:MAG: hypothetical protein KDJ29_03785 [Hyphomicrobiales bacterium]|nr:hypothetical protein [Hyphomicrobiales bacterium]
MPHRLKPIAGADNQALALNQFGSRVGCLGTGVTDGAEVIVFDRPMADLNSALWSRQVPGLLLTDNTDVGSVYPVRLRRVLKFVTAIKPSFKHIVSDA